MEATKEKWVCYYRTSTEKQALGLDVQQSAIQKEAIRCGATIVAEIEEQECGEERDRPGLNKAMALARKHKATLVAYKHDRLSRDLGFASDLIFNRGLKFKILNLPEIALQNHVVFGAMYGMAQEELKMIRNRTKDVRQEQKRLIEEQGYYISKLGKVITYMGNPKGEITPGMEKIASQSRTKIANENPNNIKASNEIKNYLKNGGKNTLQAIADHLTEEGYLTRRGVFHTPMSVKLLCQRYGIER